MAVTVTLPITADLIAANVAIGDEVTYTKSGAGPMFQAPNATFASRMYVTEIVSSTQFKYEGYNADGTVANLAIVTATPTFGDVTYTITHHLTKYEQAEDVGKVATAFGSKRTVLVWPDEGTVIDDTGAEVVVDGSFIASCLAGAKSAYPAQQGFTNLGIPGPYKLKHSNEYFTKLQLDSMSEAGVCVMVQDVDGAQIYSRHQRTTDVGIFENSELSIVTAVDKVSLDLIETCKPYIGKYNITDDFLKFLKHLGEQYLFSAKNNTAPMCGPLIIDGAVEGIRANLHGQNTDLAGGVVEMTIGIEVSKPANYINIKLMIS